MPARSDAEAKEAVAWLDSLAMFGVKLGLGNTRRLLEALGNPQRAVPSIHVAGTNGKGSVCAMLEAVFREAGQRVGLYTSPHLIRFHERIRIDGQPIPDEGLREGLERIRAACTDWEHAPTFFEVSTVLAFLWFATRCDVMVIETGMGGRLDATNVLESQLAVITPVDRDHSQWLGDSLEEIAAEKAGIIKPGRAVISAPQVPTVEHILREQAATLEAPIHFVTSPWDGPLRMEGRHQRWNAALAAEAARHSGVPATESAIARGLASAVWPGRFQRIPPRWILDGAHNPHAVRALVGAWKESFGTERPPIIFGCLDDKDAPSLIALLEGIAGEFHFVPVASSRSVHPNSLAHLTTQPTTLHPNLPAALETCAAQGRPVLITGSLYLVGEALSLLTKS